MLKEVIADNNIAESAEKHQNKFNTCLLAVLLLQEQNMCLGIAQWQNKNKKEDAKDAN